MTDTHIGSRMSDKAKNEAELAKTAAFFASGVKPRAVDVYVKQEESLTCYKCQPALVFPTIETYLQHRCTSLAQTQPAIKPASQNFTETGEIRP